MVWFYVCVLCTQSSKWERYNLSVAIGEDFFEINILRVRKKEISCVFVVISQLIDQSISQRASCL